jgi:hypothetical protein
MHERAEIVPPGDRAIGITPGERSDSIRWRSGTIQGAMVSPTLFNIWIEAFL